MRRRLLPLAALLTAPLVLTGCSGFGGGGGDSADGGDSITFTTWASESEQAAFESLITDFEAANDGASVELNVVPYDQMFSNIDAQLSSGEAPDVFRVDYGNLGVYSSQEQLLDVTDQIPEFDSFTPAFQEAVSYDGVPYGVPHQTDVSALLVNTALLEAAGVTDIPTAAADAWTWEEFADVSTKLRASLPAEQYPFAANWQLGGTTRWLSWLFEADGALLEEDGTTPAIDSEAGAKAVDFTKSFFENGWVPPTSSVKSPAYADSLFTEQTTAMAFVGSFLVPDVDNLADFEWTATPMPVDERGATDLGGNALVATADTDNPELATAFLSFMTEADNMAAFCAATNELPTRTDIDPASIDFQVRPDVMPVFAEQATTITPSDVKQLTSPFLAEISVGMQDQLEEAFVNGRSTEETLSGLTDAITQATGE
ncbi:extracellular solute-binding protein [Rathayibacter sp. VKM Ac-2803]|uniref:ABC transporter substrate-binding protein n=1 Tax=Rathayibacter sp. VKM Ac-2803 TaxID=2609256 RepID=UPI00135848F5|nr:sugar ABC transporter substrate-binding protein [Rathayibacter sp. VKM Ac-2803]MWV48621.1 extracellular solute-binding protein [Rathayibacter sp. VKM Ac-2803]